MKRSRVRSQREPRVQDQSPAPATSRGSRRPSGLRSISHRRPAGDLRAVETDLCGERNCGRRSERRLGDRRRLGRGGDLDVNTRAAFGNVRRHDAYDAVGPERPCPVADQTVQRMAVGRRIVRAHVMRRGVVDDRRHARIVAIVRMRRDDRSAQRDERHQQHRRNWRATASYPAQHDPSVVNGSMGCQLPLHSRRWAVGRAVAGIGQPAGLGVRNWILGFG